MSTRSVDVVTGAAYRRSSTAVRRLVDTNAAGEPPAPIADWFDSLAQPTWSPDGLQLAYHRNTQGPTDERPSKIRIEIVNVDGTGLRELPAPDGETKAGDPDWSPDGSLIVFSTMPNREGEGDGNGSTGIFTIHPDGTGLTDLCGNCLGGGIAPSWAPDGQHILFWGFRTWAMMEPDGNRQAHINPSKLEFAQGFRYFALLQPSP